MSESDDGSFKVVDKRRFDSSGKVKEEDERTAPVGNTSSGVKNSRPDKADLPPKKETRSVASGGGPASGVTFSAFVVSLATQVLMQLGEAEPPPGVDLPKDLAGAKQTIDILDMLAEKTKGNVDEGEAQLLREVLHSIKMAYVQATRK